MEATKANKSLCIDFGNTKVKIAIFQDGELIKKKAYLNLSERRVDILLEDKAIQKAILVSVRDHDPELEDKLKEKLFFIKFTHETPIPIQNHYATPHTLGKDRLAAVIGAQHLFPQENLLVIDAGTCIKYDAIDKERNYYGGSISPGIRMRFQALHTFTDKLPLVKRAAYDLVGTSTNGAILSGVLAGVKAEIEGIIVEYQRKFPDIKVLLTGGDAKYFETQIKNEIFVVPNLIFDGLNAIVEYNAAPAS